MRLTDLKVKQAKPGQDGKAKAHTDGLGMYLFVNDAGKYWRVDYRFAGKRKTLALGVYPHVTLAQARQKRAAARELLDAGQDPGAAKKEEKRAVASANENTFEVVARQYLRTARSKLTPKTHETYTAWMEKHIFPFIGAVPISTLGPRDALAVAQRVEKAGAVATAHRVLALIGTVMRYAVATGSAERDCTTDLRGALRKVVTEHHPALTDPVEVAQLLRSIHSYRALAPSVLVALKLLPLLFVRPTELRAATWAEIDLDAAEWRIPADRMKSRRDHIVPLSTQAVGLLRELHPLTGHGTYVFANVRNHAAFIGETTLSAALRALGYDSDRMTAHGFRAMARTLLDEVLHEPFDLIEHQLAHAVRDATGRAYNRTSHLPARRAMMQRWADYLDRLRMGADVIPLRVAS